MSWLEQFLQIDLIRVGTFSIHLGQLAAFVLIIVATLLISSRVGRAITRLGAIRSRVSDSQAYAFSRLFSYSIITTGFFLALASLGLTFDRVLVIAGALGVGIGFGLQNIANNFVSGIIILFEKSLRVGDFVELEAGLLGEVREINVRSTLIRTLDNADILVPNSEFVNGRVNNWTLEDNERRFSIHFSVAYGTDTDLVQTLVRDLAREHPLTYETPTRQTVVLMTGFGDSSLNFVLSVWARGDVIKRPGLVKSDYLLAINKALVKNHIEIPFPQRDLHLRSSDLAAAEARAAEEKVLSP